MTEVFYRKWRPQTLADVVGQEPITKTLLNALASGRIAHAYLFFGPRGTGKTSTGRILAKAVNCLKNDSGEPCNACSMCQAFIEGRALDLIEIDAASNRGIDEIRDLKEKINFAPNIAKYKVYIIDEVHMLTDPAFNALLKTLEEPPAHVIFVLATTEAHKVPATITSRCQRFDFRRISQAAMTGKLEQICRKEGIKAEPQALALIAKSATGSLRDAENLMEQIVVYHGPNIELQQVRSELGITGDARIKELAKLILERNISDGLAAINSVADDGLDLRQSARELVDYLRGILLLKAGATEAIGLGAEEAAEMKEIGTNASLRGVSEAIKLFAQADFRFSPQSTLPLELALVEYAMPKSGGKSEGVISPPTKEKTAEEYIPTDPQKVSNEPPVSSMTKPHTPPAGSSEIEHIQRHWNDFINACRGEGSSGNLDALLRRSCKPISLEDNILRLGFYAEFQKSKIEDPKYGRMVERKLEDVFGVPYQISCVLIGKEDRPTPPSARESPLVQEVLNRGGKIISEE